MRGHHMTSQCITWHHISHQIRSHHITWHLATNHITSPHVTSQPTTLLHLTMQPTTSKQVTTSPPWNGWRFVHSNNSVWASQWLVTLCTFYRQILSLTYSFISLKLPPPACPAVLVILRCYTDWKSLSLSLSLWILSIHHSHITQHAFQLFQSWDMSGIKMRGTESWHRHVGRQWQFPFRRTGTVH